jgi:hypothetical protein
LLPKASAFPAQHLIKQHKLFIFRKLEKSSPLHFPHSSHALAKILAIKNKDPDKSVFFIGIIFTLNARLHKRILANCVNSFE